MNYSNKCGEVSNLVALTLYGDGPLGGLAFQKIPNNWAHSRIEVTVHKELLPVHTFLIGHALRIRLTLYLATCMHVDILYANNNQENKASQTSRTEQSAVNQKWRARSDHNILPQLRNNTLQAQNDTVL